MTANFQPSTTRGSSGRSGLCLLLAILAIFTAVNFLTGTRYPTAWQDEVLYTDPAANCYFGHGFTSSMWPAQPYGTFWAGNVPLHQFLLTGWFHLFGFSLLSARSMNYVLMAIAAFVLWRTWQKCGLVCSKSFSTVALLAILCGTGTTISYRSARPDCIAILMASLAFAAFTLPSAKHRKITLFLLGIFFPAAGIQLVIFAFFFSGLLVVWTRGRLLPEVISLGCGIAMGLGALAGLYAAHGALHRFIEGVTKYSNVGVPTLSLGQRLRNFWAYFTVDKSQLGLLLVALGLLAARMLGLVRFAAGRLIFVIGAWFVVIGAMMILGKFPVYYSWMPGLPLAIGLASAMENAWRETVGRMWICLSIASALCFSALGLPMKMTATALRWPDRNINALDDYVRPNAAHPGWLLADYQAYFSLKNSSNVVVAFPYLETATPEEKAKIGMAIVQPSQVGKVQEKLGDNWKGLTMPFISTWSAINSPNIHIFHMAKRLTTNPQDADWQLCVYERTP